MQEIKEIHLEDYKTPSFKIEKIDLRFELNSENTTVFSTMEIKKQDQSSDLVLDALNLELLDIKLNELPLTQGRYLLQEEFLVIKNVPQNFRLSITNRIYPQNNTELEGLYKSGGIFCTQCEPEGFRRITPYIDRPDVMAEFTTTLVANKKEYPVLLSNGNFVQEQQLKDDRVAVTWHDPYPKSSYLFALVAGDLGVVSDNFTTMSGKEIALNIYCDKGNESKCTYAMRSLKEAMAWDEEKYGREYDLDIYNIVAVDSFNMGAMENKGLNIFNSAYVLADSDTATDANFMGVESVIAHEYFHNWTGNRITCRDWFQLTLKEGLTVFRDQCFSADMNSAAIERIESVKGLRERQFVEDASPTRHPIQPKSYISMNNFYTATVYEKGAEVIRMLYTLLGEKKWRKAMDLYFETFDSQAVTTDDFLWCMAQVSNIDIEHFKLWYDQSGTPQLHIQESFKDGTFYVECRQKVPKRLDATAQKPLYYPLNMAIFAQDGTLIEQKIVTITKEREVFTFNNLDVQPILSVNRNFSAPIIVKQEAPDYSFLMQFEKDPFAQYEAGQEYAAQTLEKVMQGEAVAEEFIDIFGFILECEHEPAFKALLLELPSVSTMMQRQEPVECLVIYDALKKLNRCLAERYKDKLMKMYHDYHEPYAQDVDARTIANRALKNRILKILAALKSKEIALLAKKQYETSLSMSDRVAALDILESLQSPFAQEAFNHFYNRYKDNSLVMNKYFALLAGSSRSNLLEVVKDLERDDAYDSKVPNLVRSLVGTFTRNYEYFHAKDGSGYKYVADKILEIDKINPQMASALCSSFKLYDRMNHENQSLMKRELIRVVSTHSLSKNSFEILNKILNKK
jgi:aminopeptidase N